jgi:predicted Zn-dependent protease
MEAFGISANAGRHTPTEERTRRSPLRCWSGLLAIVAVLVASASSVRAQSESGAPGIARVRDAEIEQYLRQWEMPVWQAAGLSPDALHIILINDDQINSFVAGGQNIFIYTGLLIRSDSANQVIGVMAHETGHIAGGHLARMSDAIQNAEIPQILGLILGAAASVAGHNPGAFAAGAGAGSSIAERTFLSFSRTQERSADQAAVTFLDRTDQSARGLLEFMRKLQGQEFMLGLHESPYLQTHPLTQDRIDFLQHVVDTSKYANLPPRPGYAEEHARMVGKLIGFLDPIPRVFQKFKPDDHSVEARYARSIAEHRLGKEADALKLIDGLIAEKPDDPFYNELKGQFLFEAGKVREAVGPYQTADRLLPHNPLIETEMAQAMVETGEARYDKQALEALNDAVTRDRDNGLTWRMLATIHGRQGDEGTASLDLAEEAYAEGRYADAEGEAKRAQRLLPVGSPGALRAHDIEQAAADAKKGASG